MKSLDPESQAIVMVKEDGSDEFLIYSHHFDSDQIRDLMAEGVKQALE